MIRYLGWTLSSRIKGKIGDVYYDFDLLPYPEYRIAFGSDL